MSLDSGRQARAQAASLVLGLSSSSSASLGQGDLWSLVAPLGAEAEQGLLLSLLAYLPSPTASPSKSPTKASSAQLTYLAQLLKREGTAKPRSAFLSRLLRAYDASHSQSPRPGLPSLARLLRLSSAQECILSLTFLGSAHAELRNSAEGSLTRALPSLFSDFADPSGDASGGLEDCPVEALHLLLHAALTKPRLGVSEQLRKDFAQALAANFASQVPLVLLPFLSDACESSMDSMASLPLKSITGSLALQVQEMGPSAFGDVESWERELRKMGVGSGERVSSSAVAHVLAMMTRPSRYGSSWSAEEGDGTGAPGPWNIADFVKAVNRLQPTSSADWAEVVAELDQPGFSVKDRTALSLLHAGLSQAFPDPKTFPLPKLLASWTNKEGQLSWIGQLLRNPEVLDLSAVPCRKGGAAPVEQLKTGPEEWKEAGVWKSLELVECLLQLSDSPGLFKDVETLFLVPLQKCPDLLCLSLLHVGPPVNGLRHELLGNLMPLLFGSHPSALSLLHLAWDTALLPQQSMRTLILAAMSAWYMGAQDDEARLGQILELAQELKALSPLLASSQLPFALDLACLASRRDFLNLHKWLADKIREHKESMVEAVLGLISRRGPGNLPPEILSVLLLSLQPLVPNLPQQMAQEVQALLKQFPQGGPGLGGGSTTPSSAAPGSNPIMDLLNSAAVNSSGKSSAFPSGFGDVVGSGQPTRNPFSAPTPTPFHRNQGPVGPVGGGAVSGAGPTGLATSVGGSVSPARGLGGIGAGLGGALGERLGAGSGLGLGASALGGSLGGSVGGGLGRMGMSGASGGWRGSSSGGLAAAAPGPMDASGPAASAAPVPDISQSYSEEVQEEANSYFQQIYSQPPQPTMSIGDFIGILRQFRDSEEPKQHEVFGCMLKNLFEEYRFFPEYPDRELQITALVYGSIVRENIISGMHMAYAMRGVMEAIKKESGSKMFYFGLAALEQFKGRLKDYPRYSQCVAALPHFQSFPSHLVAYVQAGANSQDPNPGSIRSETPVVPPSLRALAASAQPGAASTTLPSQRPSSTTARPPPSLSQATNITTLVSATEQADRQVQEPVESIQEKVAFLFNNLSQANLAKKVEDLWEEVLERKEDLLPWLAQYLVMKRVSIEPNFHNLYANLVTSFPSSTPYEKLALEETYRNVRILLRSDKRQAASNFADRQLLKNLGHWLGMITLAKNKPILHLHLDIKSLLLEGYYKGQQQLLFVVPFVAKILESCSKSLVFKVPNAWTMGILNLLGELHAEPDLKLNLKFEIEVLCKSLGPVELSSLKPGALLKDTDRIEGILSSGRQQLDDVGVLTKQVEGLTVGPSPVAGGGAQAAAQSDDSPAPLPAPLSAKYAYHSINVTSFSGLTPHLSINHQLELFQMNPPLKNVVRGCVEHAVRELIQPVAERAIKVAMTTTEHVVKKDFALEADEGRMRAAAHHMVRSLTAGMAMITCREPLVATIQGYLKSAFFSSFRGANSEQTRVIEEAALAVAEDNVELAQCFIVKSACEKAIPEIDKRLEHEFSVRRSAKMENRRYCDPNTLTYHAERMPEPIRLNVGSITPLQQDIYKNFSSSISGFKPTTADDLILGFGSEATATQPLAQPLGRGGEDQLESYYQRLVRDMDSVMVGAGNPSSPALSALRSMREALAVAAQQPKDPVAATNLVQKLVEILLASFKTQSNEPEQMGRLRDAFMVGCKLVCSIFGVSWVMKTITKLVVECRQEIRFNLDAIDVLIRAQLLSLPEYDAMLAQTLADPINFQGIQFAQNLIKRYFSEPSQSCLSQTDLRLSIEALGKIGGAYGGSGRAVDGSVASVLEMIRSDEAEASGTAAQGQAQSGPSSQPVGGQTALPLGGVTLKGREAGPGDEESAELQQKAEAILRDWLPMAYTPTYVKEPSKAFSLIVQTMHQHGILRTDDMITRFFKLCTEMCVDLSYRLLKDPANQHHMQMVRGRCFYTLDAYVKLISILVKHSGDGAFATKINLLNKVLGVIAQTLVQDQQVRGTEFHQLPYHRLLIMLFWELTTPDPLLDPINFQILTSFCNTLHMLQPRKVPGFAYAWLDMVGHRAFIGRMLVVTPQQKAWPMYAQLLIDHLKFLAPFLRNIDLPRPIALMYKGTLRVLLVVLHDFPDLLVEYGYLLCDVIPPNCVQLRNLVLSAYPPHLRLPDPFMPGLKVEEVPEIRASPPISPSLPQLLGPLKTPLDEYLTNRMPVSFLSELPSKLKASDPSLYNALVVYLGSAAIGALRDKEELPSPNNIAHSSYMDVFQSLAVNLDTEGRYLFFNAIANQLRYPNSHTHYFSSLLLYLFSESNQEVIQEQMTRILFERLVALRPHPWGLLITFIQLIKNPQYKFWSHNFVRCAPEIERLFESVAASCFKHQQPNAAPQPPQL